MNGRPSPLFDAFHYDHAVLGRGLFEIETQLRGRNIEAAKAAAGQLDRDAGAHIAFEEQFFYPVLRRLIGKQEVNRFYREHNEGLDLVRSLVELPARSELSDDRRRELLDEAVQMQRHVIECGELFGALGRIPLDEQATLHQQLLRFREQAPRWTEVNAPQEAGG
jgi:uncharacterized membrane protein YccC